MAALLIQAVAVGLFIAGSSLALWIAGAILVGISSAIVWASCLSLIVSRTEKSQLAQVLSYTSISLSCGDFLGPVTGGAIYGAGGAEAVWGLVFGLIGIDAVLRLLMIETPVDLAGSDAVVGSGGKPTTHRAENDSALDSDDESTSSTDPAGHDTIVDSGDEPTTASSWSGVLQLLKSPRLLGALWVTVTQATILTSFDASLTIHLRNTFHWKSTQAGLVFISLIFPGVDARVHVAREGIDLGAQIQDGLARFVVVEQAGAGAQRQAGGHGEGQGNGGEAELGRFDHRVLSGC